MLNCEWTTFSSSTTMEELNSFSKRLLFQKYQFFFLTFAQPCITLGKGGYLNKGLFRSYGDNCLVGSKSGVQ